MTSSRGLASSGESEILRKYSRLVRERSYRKRPRSSSTSSEERYRYRTADRKSPPRDRERSLSNSTCQGQGLFPPIFPVFGLCFTHEISKQCSEDKEQHHYKKCETDHGEQVHTGKIDRDPIPEDPTQPAQDAI